MVKRQRQKIDLGSDDASLNSPFAALAGLRDTLPEGATPANASEHGPKHGPREQDRSEKAEAFAPRLVVWSERKGRGGKTVTLVRGVLLRGAALELFLKQLRSALGTRAQLEDDALVLGGDQRQRLADWLRQQGARQVVLGN